MTEPDRDYFPQPAKPVAVLMDVHLLMRPIEHAPTFAEAVAAICCSREAGS